MLRVADSEALTRDPPARRTRLSSPHVGDGRWAVAYAPRRLGRAWRTGSDGVVRVGSCCGGGGHAFGKAAIGRARLCAGLRRLRHRTLGRRSCFSDTRGRSSGGVSLDLALLEVAEFGDGVKESGEAGDEQNVDTSSRFLMTPVRTSRWAAVRKTRPLPGHLPGT